MYKILFGYDISPAIAEEVINYHCIQFKNDLVFFCVDFQCFDVLWREHVVVFKAPAIQALPNLELASIKGSRTRVIQTNAVTNISQLYQTTDMNMNTIERCIH